VNPTVDPDALASIASQYTQRMTSIRGRRVQRLLKREFAGAEHVLLVQAGSGSPAALGLSATGAAFCATDGRGPHATVLKWLHGSATAVETRFDLLKDSLPVRETRSVTLGELRAQVQGIAPASPAAAPARALLASALQALAGEGARGQ
jgi:hypothetical protein